MNDFLISLLSLTISILIMAVLIYFMISTVPSLYN
jgi:hypothetical protein